MSWIVISVFRDLTEEQDLTLAIMYTLSMALIVAGIIKAYLKEFVDIDKI